MFQVRGSSTDPTPIRDIIEKIADREGVDVTEIEPPTYDPLYAVVDPEALDELVRRSSGDSEVTIRVGFEYEGYEVVVHGDGRVEVSESVAVEGRDDAEM